MSAEQSQTRAKGDSAWLGIERNALFKHGIDHEFYFWRRHRWKDTFVTKLGLSIAQNANLVKKAFGRHLSCFVWWIANPSPTLSQRYKREREREDRLPTRLIIEDTHTSAEKPVTFPPTIAERETELAALQSAFDE